MRQADRLEKWTDGDQPDAFLAKFDCDDRMQCTEGSMAGTSNQLSHWQSIDCLQIGDLRR